MKDPRYVQIELTDSVAHTGKAWKETLTLTLSELERSLKAQDHGQLNASDRSGDVCSAALVYTVISQRNNSPDTSLPTYFEVLGCDGFYAQIPWSFADSAMFRFPADASQDGPASEVGTANGEGLRLYIEDGPNACLNVKSIVHIRFAGDKVLAEPIFGSRLP